MSAARRRAGVGSPPPARVGCGGRFTAVVGSPSERARTSRLVGIATGRRGDGGQSTAELAVALPAVVLLALFVVQVGQVVRHQILVVHVAREAARASAVSGGAAHTEATPGVAAGLDPRRLTVTVRERDGAVQVDVRYDDPTDVALVGQLMPDVGLGASAVMRLEG